MLTRRDTWDTTAVARAMAVAIAYVITPLVQKEAVRLSPFVILFAVLAGGAFVGILGALLAIPVAAVVAMVLDELAPRHEAPEEQGATRQAD